MSGEISTTLTSLADGADLLLTGMNFEDVAANVAEYCDIPLATLHYLPAAGQRPAPAIPACAVGPLRNDGVRVAGLGARRRRSRMRSAVNSVCRKQQAPGRDGSPNADRLKSRPTTRCATPGWQPNGRNGKASGPLSAR